MDLVSKQALSPIKSPPSSIFGSPIHSSNTSFPILFVAIIGILATAFLLVSYYIFVIKCCLNWHRIDLLSRFSFSRNRRSDPIGLYSPTVQRRGLEESVIQAIPILQFKKGDQENGLREKSFSECSVCLNDFQEEEKVRAIPNCGHVFHVDCIDVWLQSNVNCPLCRTSISTSTTLDNQIVAPSSSPQIPDPNTGNNNNHRLGSDEDYVVIELRGERENSTDQTLLGVQERLNNSPRKFEKKVRRLNHVLSKGDECIDIREKDDQFSVQPIRRSFSMDSACDRQLCLAVQEIVEQNRNVNEVNNVSEGCSSRVRRSFFPFANGRGSRSAVLPIQLDS
ncbi:unnamed protein product [Camellia sinensis]